MLYARKFVLSLAIAASMTGAAQADLLGGGVAGGLASQIETRTVGSLGDHGGDAWGRADAIATGKISTTEAEQIRSEARGTVSGTAQGVVHSGQDLGAQTQTQSRAALRRANRAARRAATDGAVVANDAYASSTSAASNVGAVVNSGSDADVGIATEGAYVGTSGSARGDLAASSGDGLESAVQSGAAANTVVDSRYGGTAEGSVESMVAGSASAK